MKGNRDSETEGLWGGRELTEAVCVTDTLWQDSLHENSEIDRVPEEGRLSNGEVAE